MFVGIDTILSRFLLFQEDHDQDMHEDYADSRPEGETGYRCYSVLGGSDHGLNRNIETRIRLRVDASPV